VIAILLGIQGHQAVQIARMECFFRPVKGSENFAHILIAALDLGPSVYIDLACIRQGRQTAPGKEHHERNQNHAFPEGSYLLHP
jgi:hypothetical protein